MTKDSVREGGMFIGHPIDVQWTAETILSGPCTVWYWPTGVHSWSTKNHSLKHYISEVTLPKLGYYKLVWKLMWLCSLVFASEHEHVVWRQWTLASCMSCSQGYSHTNEKLKGKGREPSKIYQMKNITGREDLITCGQMNLPTLHWQNILVQCECFMAGRMGLDCTTLHYLPV